MTSKLILATLLFSVVACVGCGTDPRSGLIKDFQAANETNVAKVKTCVSMFQSRNNFKTPKDKEELLSFLKSGKVDRNLKRLGIAPSSLDGIFISENDGQEIKVRYGVRLSMNRPEPVAFEAVGVNGVRLVAADVVLEVKDDEEYDRLWNGEYTPASMSGDEFSDAGE